jgi:signal transduction histidine kinase
VGQGIAGWVAEHARPALVDDARADGRHEHGMAARIGYAARTILCVPLVHEERAIGAIELINREGRDRFSEHDVKVLTLIAGQAARAISIQRAREERLKAERLSTLGQMLAGILHDLKTPVTVAGGYVQLMSMEEDRAKREQYSEQVVRQLGQLDEMTREVLAFARGERKILLRPVHLNGFMAGIEEQLQSEFAGSGVALAIDVRYRGAIHADEGKLRRLIFNIARNARQAMPNGGRFEVVVDREGDYVVLRLADDGPGIPEALRHRVFEAFVTTGKPDGTGLGLAIVKRIVDEHNGRIELTSEPGRGATFVVRLPIGQ